MEGQDVVSACVVDAELLEAAKAGDADAFDAIYRRTVTMVVRVVARTLGSSDGASDVVQEVFCRVLERLPSLRQTDRFVPWLATIARNAAIDHGRGRWRAEPDNEASVRLRDRGPGPDELVELRQLAEVVRGQVADLSTRDAQAVSLVVDLGFSPAEVASALGIATGAARVRLHRARRRLRDALTVCVLSHQANGECEQFRAFTARDDHYGASQHAQHCPNCQRTVREELSLFGDCTSPMPKVSVGAAAC